MRPGTSYVYNIYGMYQCFNISTRESGGCVLIRALEPVEGLAVMSANRNTRRKTSPSKKGTSRGQVKRKQLCSGPPKVCQAMDITKENCNEVDMLADDCHLWLEAAVEIPDERVKYSKRVGIENSGAESRDKLFRLYEMGNEHVSVVDKN